MWNTVQVLYQVDLSRTVKRLRSIITTGNPEKVFKALFVFNKRRGGKDLEFISGSIACHFTTLEGTIVEAKMTKIKNELHNLTFLLI